MLFNFHAAFCDIYSNVLTHDSQLITAQLMTLLSTRLERNERRLAVSKKLLDYRIYPLKNLTPNEQFTSQSLKVSNGSAIITVEKGRRGQHLSQATSWYVQSRAEVSGRTRVYHNQTWPAKPSALAGRHMPGVVDCAASQQCQAAQHPLQDD